MQVRERLMLKRNHPSTWYYYLCTSPHPMDINPNTVLRSKSSPNMDPVSHPIPP